MPQISDTSRTLAMELKLIRRALNRIREHPVSPARYVAILSVEAQCREVASEFAREGFENGRKAA